MPAAGSAAAATSATRPTTVQPIQRRCGDDAVAAVNDAPGAVKQHTTSEDRRSRSAFRVLANDSDRDSAALRAVLVTGPAHGTLVLNAEGSFAYNPAANFNGVDSFTYRASDGTASSNVATVTIAVKSVNDAPVAGNNTYTKNEDTTLTVAAPGVLGNDEDVDGDR